MATDTNAFMVSQAANIIARLERATYEGIHYPQLAPVKSEGEPLAPSIEHFKIDATGDAAMTNYGADDLPRVDAQFTRYTVPCRTFGNEYAINDQDAYVARSAGRDLSAETGMESRRVLEEAIENVFWGGNDDLTWASFHQNPSVTATPLSDAFKDLLKTDAGVRALIAEINAAIGRVYEASKGQILPDTLVMPHSWFVDIQSVQIPNTTLTLAQWLKMGTVYSGQSGGEALDIVSANRLNATAPTGSALPNSAFGTGAGQERMVVYAKKESVLRFHLPMPVTAKTPYWKNPRTLVTELWSNCGGLEVLRTFGIQYLNDIV